MKRGTSVIRVVLILTLALWPIAAWAQQATTIRFGHVGFPGSLFDMVAQEYAGRVNAELKGRVEVKVFHSSQLGTDEQMIKGIKIGAPEMFMPSTVMSTVDGKYGLFEMPYIIVNRAHMKKVSENKQLQSALFEGLPAKGIRILGVWENGFRHVTNNVGLLAGEIFYLEDLARDCTQDGVYEFMFVAPPLPITGAVGSPINPLAIK